LHDAAFAFVRLSASATGTRLAAKFCPAHRDR
jgi:hypothetical protein